MFVSPTSIPPPGADFTPVAPAAAPFRLALVFLTVGLDGRLASPSLVPFAFPFPFTVAAAAAEGGRLGILFGGGIAIDAVDATLGIPDVRVDVDTGLRDMVSIYHDISDDGEEEREEQVE